MAQGEWLGAQQGVHAMMDISDGVASDLRHILKASSVGAQVDINMIPLSEELLKACAQNNWDTMQLALGGGEDFALLLTAENTVAEHYRHHFGTELYPIGTITKGSELQWINGLGRDFRGYSHF
ncbi:MAG: AIR synthase-related protein, partial [Mucinivorans sp.]